MARKPTGQIIERRGKRGTSFGLRFRAYGKRHYVTADAHTRTEAETELANLLADVRRGLWRRSEQPLEVLKAEPTFHEFASEWLVAREQEGLAERTIEDYRWALTHHLLPFFKSHRMGEITVREVDRYKTFKAGEGVLSANTANKTLVRLSQILSVAVEYELIPANPAAGKRRRLKSTRPTRAWVEPEQLMSLLEGAGAGHALIAMLVGTGLRIGEAVALCWRDVDFPTGTVRVVRSKTDAGVRVVDLTPALRDGLLAYKAGARWSAADDPVFATRTGRPQNRHNVRRSVLLPAIKAANVKLAKLGIGEIEGVGLHGLRRTYASLRAAAGDDPAYVSEQLGHEDPRFTLRVYTHAAKRRQRLTGTHREQFNKAIEWARMGTSVDLSLAGVAEIANEEARNPAVQAGLR
jgi:integrase